MSSAGASAALAARLEAARARAASDQERAAEVHTQVGLAAFQALFGRPPTGSSQPAPGLLSPSPAGQLSGTSAAVRSSILVMSPTAPAPPAWPTDVAIGSTFTSPPAGAQAASRGSGATSDTTARIRARLQHALSPARTSDSASVPGAGLTSLKAADSTVSPLPAVQPLVQASPQLLPSPGSIAKVGYGVPRVARTPSATHAHAASPQPGPRLQSPPAFDGIVAAPPPLSPTLSPPVAPPFPATTPSTRPAPSPSPATTLPRHHPQTDGATPPRTQTTAARATTACDEAFGARVHTPLNGSIFSEPTPARDLWCEEPASAAQATTSPTRSNGAHMSPAPPRRHQAGERAVTPPRSPFSNERPPRHISGVSSDSNPLSSSSWSRRTPGGVGADRDAFIPSDGGTSVTAGRMFDTVISPGHSAHTEAARLAKLEALRARKAEEADQRRVALRAVREGAARVRETAAHATGATSASSPGDATTTEAASPGRPHRGASATPGSAHSARASRSGFLASSKLAAEVFGPPPASAPQHHPVSDEITSDALLPQAVFGGHVRTRSARVRSSAASAPSWSAPSFESTVVGGSPDRHASSASHEVAPSATAVAGPRAPVPATGPVPRVHVFNNVGGRPPAAPSYETGAGNSEAVGYSGVASALPRATDDERVPPLAGDAGGASGTLLRASALPRAARSGINSERTGDAASLADSTSRHTSPATQAGLRLGGAAHARVDSRSVFSASSDASAVSVSMSGGRRRSSSVTSMSKASNKQRILNALGAVCLAGAHRVKELEAAVHAVNASTAESFLVLLAAPDALSYRACYSFDPSTGLALRIHGSGPPSLTQAIQLAQATSSGDAIPATEEGVSINACFKYSTSARAFALMPTCVVGLTTDALSVKLKRR